MRRGLGLATPALAVLVIFFVAPILMIVEMSFRPYSWLDIFGSPDQPYTIENYAQIFTIPYFYVFLDMLRMGTVSTALGVALAFPMAYFIARQPSGRLRTLLLGALVTFLFLSVLVRVYSLELTFGSVGLGKPVSTLFGVSSTDRGYSEFLVILGLMHHTIPFSALLLIATIQNVNPRYAEVAQSLGASWWRAHLSTTVPLSSRGLMSAFVINFTLAISAFVIPMILGKGKILFFSNLIYNRFGETANYPSGSAIAVELLLLSLALIYGLQLLVPQRLERV
jgi:ABC-type spermidine/putrescine transport system permease subunit I